MARATPQSDDVAATGLAAHHGVAVPASFTPAPWCPGAHLQTLWPYLLRRHPRPRFQRERLTLPDGDFLDVDWCGDGARAIVIVLHGLEGNSGSHYVRGLAAHLSALDLRVAVMHFRGCSGEPNRLPRSYHSGETGDIAWLVETLSRRYPRTPFAVVGYSLGGNVLLKWLAELADAALLTTAVAVSVPFELNRAADRLQRGFSRVYQQQLVARMRRSTERKFARLQAPIALDGLRRLRTFWQFDDQVTAPLHGFADATDYYTRCSSRQFLRRIRTPTLILHARDDPFMTPDAIPTARELAPGVRLELSAHGGHVGFVAGRVPWRPQYWLEGRIAEHILPRVRSSLEE